MSKKKKKKKIKEKKKKKKKKKQVRLRRKWDLSGWRGKYVRHHHHHSNKREPRIESKGNSKRKAD